MIVLVTFVKMATGMWPPRTWIDVTSPKSGNIGRKLPLRMCSRLLAAKLRLLQKRQTSLFGFSKQVPLLFGSMVLMISVILSPFRTNIVHATYPSIHPAESCNFFYIGSNYNSGVLFETIVLWFVRKWELAYFVQPFPNISFSPVYAWSPKLQFHSTSSATWPWVLGPVEISRSSIACPHALFVGAENNHGDLSNFKISNLLNVSWQETSRCESDLLELTALVEMTWTWIHSFSKPRREQSMLLCG